MPCASSPNMTVPVGSGYSPLGEEKVATIFRDLLNMNEKDSSPPNLSSSIKLITQPTPIAPLLTSSFCISANLCLGKG